VFNLALDPANPVREIALDKVGQTFHIGPVMLLLTFLVKGRFHKPLYQERKQASKLKNRHHQFCGFRHRIDGHRASVV
jgi:hypothetical protein